MAVRVIGGLFKFVIVGYGVAVTLGVAVWLSGGF